MDKYDWEKSSFLTYVKFLLFKYGRSLISLVFRLDFTSWFNRLTTEGANPLSFCSYWTSMTVASSRRDVKVFLASDSFESL